LRQQISIIQKSILALLLCSPVNSIIWASQQFLEYDLPFQLYP
jgi:hypothetical protein